MNAPIITLDGKTYTAGKPKVKLWRETIKFKETFAKVSVEDEKAIDEMLRLLESAFGNPEVTAAAIEEYLDLDQLVPTFFNLMAWVQDEVAGKAAQLPNVQGPETGPQT